jgi:uncharacterized protein YabE (DUF348 family)
MKSSSSPVPIAVVCCLLAVLVFSTGCGRKTSVAAGRVSATLTNQASMDELNQTLTEFMRHTGQQLPATNDVAAYLARYGKVFPVPPPGKKLVLNPGTRQFEMVDE